MELEVDDGSDDHGTDLAREIESLAEALRVAAVLSSFVGSAAFARGSRRCRRSLAALEVGLEAFAGDDGCTVDFVVSLKQSGGT